MVVRKFFKNLFAEFDKNAQWNLRRFEKAPSCNFRVAILKEHTGNVLSVTFSSAGLMVSRVQVFTIQHIEKGNNYFEIPLHVYLSLL